jgi:glycosyltransferase involved in cell wall biosynthesis
MNSDPDKILRYEKKKIQVFLATYNRPHLIEKVIDSILNQTFDSFELVVSDNSINDDTRVIIQNKYAEKVRYIQRVPSNPDHFNLLLGEVASDYFMMFHDDDTMLPDMIKELYNIIKQNEKIVAVGANAYLSINGRPTKKMVFQCSGENMILDSRDAVIKQYLTRYGIVPFPSYLYRKIVSEFFRFDTSHGGKHCDAAFIMDIADKGSVVILNKPLMNYAIHKGQDSQNHLFLHRIKLINYITKTSSFSQKNMLIKEYRVYNLYSELKAFCLNGSAHMSSKRIIKIVALVFKYLPLEYCIKTLMLISFTQYKRIRFIQPTHE